MKNKQPERWLVIFPQIIQSPESLHVSLEAAHAQKVAWSGVNIELVLYFSYVLKKKDNNETLLNY